MDYREFVERVAQDLKETLPEEFSQVTVNTCQVQKLQDESYFGLAVKPEGKPISISMDLRVFHQQLENGLEYEQVLEMISDKAVEGMEDAPRVQAEDLLDYENIKDKLMIQVVAVKGNEEMLETIPHKEVEGMAVVYRVMLETEEDHSSSVLVTNNMLENMGVDKEELHKDAMESSEKNFPPTIRSLTEVLAEMMGVPEEALPETQRPMYMATCNNGMNGASCMFYSDFMQQVTEMMQNDFFILPSSVHEILLLEDNGMYKVSELKAMVREVNESEVQPKDRLSNDVFHYDHKRDLFEKADDYMARMQEAKQKNRDEAR